MYDDEKNGKKVTSEGKTQTMKKISIIPVLLLLSVLQSGLSGKVSDLAEIEHLSKAGKTLGSEITQKFPLREQRIRNDTGINILVDLSHQANFFTMWHLPRMLRNWGFRASGSQASLDTVLTPGKLSRIRIPTGRRRPFAWWPNPRYNVVITFQASARAQEYLPEEVTALKEYLNAGGGLVFLGGRVSNPRDIDIWPLNKLMKQFGAGFSTDVDTLDGVNMSVLDLSPDWDVCLRGIKGKPIMARRERGKGRMLVLGSFKYIESKKPSRGSSNPKNQGLSTIAEMIKWTAGGTPPAGGSTRLPQEAAGGGPIYPDLSQHIGNVVVYYAKNQKKELLECINKDMPLVKSKVESWLPSTAPDEPMNLILSAGGGGGWAVNAYLPKEVGIISLTKKGILSVFAHELAHTMGGPPNAEGKVAGHWPDGNQGEAHAGWFQGKAAALPTGKRVSHQPNKLFEFDKDGTALDLALSSSEIREKWGKGKDWTKIWWIWQKLDDRYGPTWYPRWRWVQYTRWQNQPDHRLSWDETIEDMSIAVGEDLFPFFRKIGTTLTKERFARAAFRGKTIELPVAPLEVTPAGPVRLEPIGNYKEPLTVRSGDE